VNDDQFWLSQNVAPVDAWVSVTQRIQALAEIRAIRAALGIPPEAESAMVTVKAEPGQRRHAVLFTERRPLHPFLFRVGQRCPVVQLNIFGTAEAAAPQDTIRPWIALQEGLAMQVWAGSAKLANGHGAADVVFTEPHAQTRVVLQFARWKDAEYQTLGQAARWLETIKRKPGPEQGAGAKYPTPEAWHAAIRAKVLTRPSRAAVPEETIADWLGIRRSLMFELMATWGPSTLEDLRNGKFRSSPGVAGRSDGLQATE
jgi:hypothetical protein